MSSERNPTQRDIPRTTPNNPEPTPTTASFGTAADLLRNADAVLREIAALRMDGYLTRNGAPPKEVSDLFGTAKSLGLDEKGSVYIDGFTIRRQGDGTYSVLFASPSKLEGSDIEITLNRQGRVIGGASIVSRWENTDTGTKCVDVRVPWTSSESLDRFDQFYRSRSRPDNTTVQPEVPRRTGDEAPLAVTRPSEEARKMLDAVAKNPLFLKNGTLEVDEFKFIRSTNGDITVQYRPDFRGRPEIRANESRWEVSFDKDFNVIRTGIGTLDLTDRSLRDFNSYVTYSNLVKAGKGQTEEALKHQGIPSKEADDLLAKARAQGLDKNGRAEIDGFRIDKNRDGSYSILFASPYRDERTIEVVVNPQGRIIGQSSVDPSFSQRWTFGSSYGGFISLEDAYLFKSRPAK